MSTTDKSQAPEEPPKADANRPADPFDDPNNEVGGLELIDRSGLLRDAQKTRLKLNIQEWVEGGQLPKQYQVKLWGDERYQVSAKQAMQRTYYGCQALASVRANIFTYLRFVAHIEGQTMFFGDLPLTLALRDKMLAEPPKELWLDKNYTPIHRTNKNSDARPFMAVCKMKVPGSDMGWREREYTLQDARDNNKYFRDNDGVMLVQGQAAEKWLKSVWAIHTRRMLQMRARSWLLKDLAPQALNGVAQAEYDANDVPPEIMDTKDVPPHVRATQSSGGPSMAELDAKYAAPRAPIGERNDKTREQAKTN